MNITVITHFLLYALILNITVLLLWLWGLIYAREAINRLQRKCFKLSDETFDTLHYAALALYKIMIIFFNLIPLIVLYWIEKS